MGFCAEKKGVTAEVLSGSIIAAGGPSFTGTKAEKVKFHDDKALYTGVHAKGGPTTVDSVAPVASFGGPRVATTEPKAAGGAKKEEGKVPKKATTAAEPAASVDEVFYSFTGKKEEMEGKAFAKLAKDCGILDKKLTATDIDLIFAKIKDKTARKINLAQFKNGVKLCAEKKGIT